MTKNRKNKKTFLFFFLSSLKKKTKQNKTLASQKIHETKQIVARNRATKVLIKEQYQM